MSFIAFLKGANGSLKALALTSGAIIDPTDLSQIDVSNDTEALRSQLERMTITGIKGTLNELGCSVRGRGTKNFLVDAFLENWSSIQSNAVAISLHSSATSAQASSSVSDIEPFQGQAHKLGGYSSPQSPEPPSSAEEDLSPRLQFGVEDEAEIFDLLTSLEMDTYLKSPIDFYENITYMGIFDPTGNTPLFAIPIDKSLTTVAILKGEVLNRLNHALVKNGKDKMTIDDLVLCNNPRRVVDIESMDDIVSSKLHLCFRIRGGGIHQTYSKKKNIRDERLFSIKGRYNVVSYPFQLAEKAKSEAEELMNSPTGVVPDAIKKLDLASCNKLLEMWETGQTSGERFGLEIAPIFCPTLQTIDDTLEKHGKIYEMLETAFLFIFSRDYIATNGRFLLTNFKEAVVERRTELERQAEMNRLVQQAVASKGAGKGSDVEM